MDQPSALTSLVRRRGLPPEPVATETLAHLLQQSLAGREAMRALVSDLCPGVDEVLLWSDQVIGDDNARPDLVGAGIRGPRVILEAKFDANLTSAQLNGTYLARLPPDAPGLLLFLAPEDRLEILHRELTAGFQAVGIELTENASPVAALRRLQCGPLHAVCLLSWQQLLDRFRVAVTEPRERADLAQLEDLASWYMRHQWIPIGPEDLDRRTAQQVDGLQHAVMQAGALFKAPEYKVAPSSGDQNTGRYVTAASGVFAWMGFWPACWAQYGKSPLWVHARGQGALNTTAVERALSPLARSVGLYPWNPGFVTPVEVKVGAEQNQVRDALAAQLRQVLDLLDAALPPPVVGAP